MTASGGVDVANLVIEGSCTFQDYGVVQMNDGDYRLLAITSSGNLVPAQPVNIEVCVVGGGANGYRGVGGAGAYMKSSAIEAFEGGPVVVGAAQGASSIGNVRVNTLSGASGGTGGGGHNDVFGPGSGDGRSKYPFNDDSYELWAGKPHCAGGAGGGYFSANNGKYAGGNGGTDGGSGKGATQYNGVGSPNGGTGGAYGGGNGGIGSSYGQNSGSNATYYGSGGGGYGDGNGITGSNGSGYQGIVYVRIPVDQAAGGGGAPISDLPLGALINIGTDGGNGAANYEIADINNLVPGGVVLVRKNIYSQSEFSSNGNYPNSTLDNLIKTTIYNTMPQQLRDKMRDVTFSLEGSGNITRKMFALTYTMVGLGNNNGVAEGKVLQLYTSDASRVKTFNGPATEWWLSSRHSYDYARFVNTEGSAYNGNPFSTLGVVPAFVIPSKTRYDATPNTDGSYNLLQNTTISDLPLGALINVGTDGGAGTPNYEIADKDNLVSGGVVLVRKNIYSMSEFGSNENYHNGTLDNLIKTTIYNKMPQKLRDKMMDVSFPLYKSGDITRKMFALTYTMVGFGNHREVAEGKALQLYTSDASRVKAFNGSANGWWLSSRFTSGYAWYVYPDGRSNGGNSSDAFGVVPAFVIPGDTLSKLTPNTDGSYNLIL